MPKLMLYCQHPLITKLKTSHGNNTDVHASIKYGRRNALAQENIIHKCGVRFIAGIEEGFNLGELMCYTTILQFRAEKALNVRD